MKHSTREYHKAQNLQEELRLPIAGTDIYISGVVGSTYVSGLLSDEDKAVIKNIVKNRIDQIVEEGKRERIL